MDLKIIEAKGWLRGAKTAARQMSFFLTSFNSAAQGIPLALSLSAEIIRSIPIPPPLHGPGECQERCKPFSRYAFNSQTPHIDKFVLLRHSVTLATEKKQPQLSSTLSEFDDATNVPTFRSFRDPYPVKHCCWLSPDNMTTNYLSAFSKYCSRKPVKPLLLLHQ